MKLLYEATRTYVGKEIWCILKICSNGDYSYFMWCWKLMFVIFVAVMLCKMSIGVI